MALSSFDSIAESSRESSIEHRPDADLLALFLQRRGPRSEDAFAELMERHGPLVLRPCRSIVGDEHDAQDAFQATFLVLARKARGLWVRDSLAPWLHGVACRLASDLRKSAARRRKFERRMAAMGKPSAVIEEPGEVDELAAAIQEEIRRLPELHRSAVILCDMQGRTHQEVAHLLDCPVGTIKSRQSRRREQLRKRLARRGFALSSVMIGLLLAEETGESRGRTGHGPGDGECGEPLRVGLRRRLDRPLRLPCRSPRSRGIRLGLDREPAPRFPRQAVPRGLGRGGHRPPCRTGVAGLVRRSIEAPVPPAGFDRLAAHGSDTPPAHFNEQDLIFGLRSA